MSKKLVIVESPAKAKTIKKYLGSNYEVIASMGHIRDLPKSTLGVDIEHAFTPKYIAIRGKEQITRKLKDTAKKSDFVYLATDPDREGEAISWHLSNMLKLEEGQANRVTFNEITKTAVKAGIKEPRVIDQDLVDAQQARRILDRIVGYKLSPFLWKKVKRGLSAGRVQSVTVKIVVDREREINAFEAKEYWTIDAILTDVGGKKSFKSKFYGKDGKKIDLENKEQTDAILAALKDATFTVADIKIGVRKKSPAPPFTTSTLQQEASRKLGFQARRTMKAAQELYEGVEVKGMGSVGLITYMRTDSLRISNEAMDEAEAYIKEKYSETYLPKSRRVFKSKNNAQDAHEAIRPTMPKVTPEEIKATVTGDQYKLYRLIWERFIASQMAEAVYDTVSADIDAAGYLFKSSGYSVKFDGFTVLYEEGKDVSEENDGMLPKLEKGDALGLQSIQGNQHFTQPPARYTEATLIKTLEENGIGRPSTYAPTITTILARGYVEREGKVLKPTPLGEITTGLMEENFESIVDVAFTAKMEGDLDKIEEGKENFVEVLDDFYKDFEKTLEKAEKTLDGTKIKVPEEETDVICELCGRNMVIKTGRYGKFLACPGFPECKNTKRIVHETPGVCPRCGGKVLLKKSKTGKVYYGCEHNPTCNFMTWDEPQAEKCPQCGGTLFKKGGKSGKLYCAKEGCDFEKELKK